MTFTDNPFSLKTPTRNVPYTSNTRLSLRKRMKSGLKSALWEMPTGWWWGAGGPASWMTRRPPHRGSRGVSSVPGAWFQRSSEGRQAGRGRTWGPGCSAPTFGERVSNHWASSLVTPPDSSWRGRRDVTSSWLSGKERRGTQSGGRGTRACLSSHCRRLVKKQELQGPCEEEIGEVRQKMLEAFHKYERMCVSQAWGWQVIPVERRRIGPFCLPRACLGLCPSAGPGGQN